MKTVLNKNRYVVIDIPGYNLTQKSLNTIMSPDKKKPWIRVASDENRTWVTGEANGEKQNAEQSEDSDSNETD